MAVAVGVTGPGLSPVLTLVSWEGTGALRMACWLDPADRRPPGTVWHMGTSPCTAQLQGLVFPTQC